MYVHSVINKLPGFNLLHAQRLYVCERNVHATSTVNCDRNLDVQDLMTTWPSIMLAFSSQRLREGKSNEPTFEFPYSKFSGVKEFNITDFIRVQPVKTISRVFIRDWSKGFPLRYTK